MTPYFRASSALSHLAKRALLSLAVLTACASGAAAEELAPAQKGEELAKTLCARCHSIDRLGASPFAEAPPFRDFSGKWPLESLEEAFAEGIVVGHPAMPEFTFEPADIQNLLSYIATLWQ